MYRRWHGDCHVCRTTIIFLKACRTIIIFLKAPLFKGLFYYLALCFQRQLTAPPKKYPDAANNFHFYNHEASRVEFESDEGLAFYIEAGPEDEAWYGLQQGAHHHWSFGYDASDGYALKFASDSFGLTDNAITFTIHKNGTITVGGYGDLKNVAYGFDKSPGTGLFMPDENQLSLSVRSQPGLSLFVNKQGPNLSLFGSGRTQMGLHNIILPEGAVADKLPDNGGALFVKKGALYWKSSHGRITKIAKP